MKKPVIHYVFYRAGIPGALLIACGLGFWRYLLCLEGFVKSNTNKRKVTCKNCKRTKIYRSV